MKFHIKMLIFSPLDVKCFENKVRKRCLSINEYDCKNGMMGRRIDLRSLWKCLLFHAITISFIIVFCSCTYVDVKCGFVVRMSLMLDAVKALPPVSTIIPTFDHMAVDTSWERKMLKKLTWLHEPGIPCAHAQLWL